MERFCILVSGFDREKRRIMIWCGRLIVFLYFLLGIILSYVVERYSILAGFLLSFNMEMNAIWSYMQGRKRGCIK